MVDMPKRRTVHAGGGGGVRKAAKRLRARYLGALALTALAVVTTMFALPSAARAALADHTVSGVSPRGTTINLFDYWITGQSDSDQSNPDNYQNLGINAGGVLKFGAGMGNGSATSSLNGTTVNQWTQSAEPRTGIVTDELGEDGYPVLSQSLGGGSLSYLFSSEAAEGKAAYTDVDGLLQVDDQGYYYYNSQKNFAQFNEDGVGSGDFTLYDTWGVKAAGSSPNGQFFPFNTGNQVFRETGSGITQNNITSTDSEINHYFGLSMSTRFVQQDGGRTAPEGTAGSQAVTYNFSGDDDVWIYIDGVLVGDLGGIHDATSIQINFETGDVVVYRDGDNDNQYDNGETVYEDTTLKAIFTAAGVAGQYAWSGDTFADDTYHTLDFFYLERGNTDSNMSLKYNLVNIPESGVVKVDQAGTAMPGVQFTLHQADENYDIVQGGMTISATTDANGEMVFTTKNSSGQELPITLEQLNDQGGDYWVLTEDGVPEGYRSAGDMHLRFENGLLLASNEWDTGAWSQPHVTVTAPTTVREYGDHSATHDSGDGVMFAVVFQKGDDGQWYPVSGDAFGGWTVADGNTTADVVAAAKENQYQFLLGSGGAYEVTIEDLPGDITTYEYVLKNNGGDADDALYNVQYYWADADAINDIDISTNVVRIDADETEGYEGMDRVFSVTLNVPNIKNELTLEKTDVDTRAPMQGVAFSLYADENRDGEPDNASAPLSIMTTDENGKLNVYSDTDEEVLAEGSYVLVETTPEGYVNETDPIQIVVDGDGVHVDAGTATDNVTVETGIGSLMYSMKGFAAGDDVDATLHDVKAQAQTASAYDGSVTAWDDAAVAVTHYRYNGSNDKDLSYVRNDSVTGNGGATYTAEAGWSRLNIVQCRDHEGDLANGPKEDLSAQSLNALFTGAVTIHVTNSKVPTTSSLTVSKTVTGTGAPDDASFEFSLQFTDGSVTGPLTATVTDADGTETEETLTATDGSFTFSLKNGEKIEIGSLPIGATYEVTEEARAHYTQGATLAGTAVSDDDLSNGLNVSGTISQTAANNSVAFTNEFTGGSVEYSTVQAVNVSKVLNGRDMAESEFTIQVAPADDESAELLNLESKDDVLEVPMGAADDGQKVVDDVFGGKGIVFTGDDAGTYRFTVSEEQPAGGNPSEGVTYDTAVYDLTIEVTVDENGVVKVVTTATDNADYTSSQTVLGGSTAAGAVEIPFVNTYKATGQLGGDGSVAIEAHKTLENKNLAGDDFTFTVSAVNANGTKRVDATAKNDVQGDITFPAIEYTTDSLAEDVASGYATQGVDENGNDTYTYTYEVAEDTSGFSSVGLSTAQASYTVEVTVTDDGDGTLGVAVAYPEGSSDGLEFVNEYGAGASAKLAIGGTKVYEENGLENAPSIEGEYTFTLTGEDGAPLPENTTATNSNGSFSFGEIEFDIEDLGGAASKTFTYTVYESGTVEGVQNDENATTGKTFEVTLTDDGDGTISIDSVAQQAAGNQVSFTNTYSVDPTDPTNPTGSDDPALTITKTLTGRALREGEFSFTIATASDYGDAVSPNSISAVNTLNEDGTGSVVFTDGFTFSEPGYYDFTIKEDASSLGGVTTDTAAYQATAHVTDNGSGKLVVDSWKITDADGREVSQVTFENAYEAAPSAPVYLSVSKELDGGELADGQFTFELTGSDGAPLPDATEATNDADGTVSFGAITFDEAGEYDYTVTEVDDGQDGISYDADATRTIHVSVTDNGEGSLVAEVSYGQDGSVFVNSVIPTDAGGSSTGDAGSDSGLPGTGDYMLAGAVAVLAAGAAAVAVGLIIQIRRRG